MKMKTRNLEWKKILEVAKQAAIEAGDNALKHYTKVKALKGKPASTDEYTPVDVENEKKIVKILSSHFPEDSILSEERKPPRQLKEFFWLVDPLDGSISYFFGLPYWSVSLALIHKGLLSIGTRALRIIGPVNFYRS